MSFRKIAVAIALSLGAIAAPALAVPQTRVAEAAAAIPFDPPLGESVSYRWERTDEKDGKADISWAVHEFRFEEVADGYRVTVEPVSSGTNENDPVKQRVIKRLNELTKRPFVLRLNHDAEIMELEHSDEYWARIIEALRDGLSEGMPEPGGAEAIKMVTDMFERMSPDARLAQLTENIQPILEFAMTESSVGDPISVQVDTPSLFGGTLKQDVVISLTKVQDGFAYLTNRSSIPREELEKLTAAVVELAKAAAPGKLESSKAQAQLAALKEFKSETVSDYKVALDDGLLETFQSRRTISVIEADKPLRRVTSTTLSRVR